MKECFSVEDYRKNRLQKFETGTLLGFQAAPGGAWTWASGDATKAYPEDVLKKFVRQIVYLKDAGALVVYDEAEPAREADRPVFLVQCVREPTTRLAPQIARIVNSGKDLPPMELYVLSLLPAAADVKIDAIHGPDVHGTLIWEGARKSTVEKLGAWRVELSRKAGGPTRFLVVLAWRPYLVGRRPLPKAELFKEAGRVGARVAGKYEVLFDPDPAKPPIVRAAE